MPLSFLIRDAIAPDVERCAELPHSYHTKNVWQMTINKDGNDQSIHFREERLPREMKVDLPVDEIRLRLALAHEVCFLVAEEKEAGDLLGYLILRPDPTHKIGLIQDLLVTEHVRRNGIGSRLLKIARLWALERGAEQLMIETQTKNIPAIYFCIENGLSFCGYNDQYFQNQDIAVFFGQPLR